MQIEFTLAAIYMDRSRNILLLDSNEQSAQDIQRFLKVSAYAFSISHASDLSEGINYIKNRKPDLVLLDANLTTQKDFPGFTQLTHTNNVPVILLSEMSEYDARLQAERAGATDYLVKNKINLFHLQKSIANTLKLSEAEARLDDSVTRLSQQNMSLTQLLNKVNCGVLLLSEKNLLLYANEKMYGLMSTERWRSAIAAQLVYREIEKEEITELSTDRRNALRITTTSQTWNGEQTVLLLAEEIESKVDVAFTENEDALLLLNSVRDYVLLSQNNLVVFANKNALQVLKQKWADVKDKPLGNFLDTGDTPQHLNLLASPNLQQENTGFIKQPDGQLLTIKFSRQPLMLAGTLHQLLLFTVVVKDEEQMIPGARNDEERFSSEGVLHLASHDLREPVRTILNYVQLIGDNLQNKRYEEATEYANYAKDAAGRMEKLLSDLKTYIGLNEHKFTLSKVSMKISLNDVLRQMKPRLEEANAEISFAELPDVSADRELVEKLLFHLIDNAMKFRKPGKNPVIDIGYDKFEGNTIFCVRDNGIGISRKYYGKIFNLFERLNRVDEFPGNGLGLSICKKITDMHGGEIWVESLPGSGSNFYFTLKGK